MDLLTENLKIQIKPIPNRNGIREFSEELEFLPTTHTIHPFVNPVTLKYETGLSQEDYEYLKSKNFPYYEQAIDENHVSGVAHPFWESNLVKVSLGSGTTFLSPGKNLLDFIKWKYLLKSYYVYSSEEEIQSGNKPEATHYIYSAAEETALKASRIQRKNALLKSVSRASLDRKKQFILLINNEITDGRSEDYITVVLDEILDDSTRSYELEELLKLDKDDLSVKADVILALKKNILKKTRQGVFYYDTNLGFSNDSVIEYLKKPENQELYLNIKSKL